MTRPFVKNHFDNIVDTMTGDDGGARFAHLKIFIDEMDKRAVNGDAASEQIITVMVRFSRLIDLASEIGEQQ